MQTHKKKSKEKYVSMSILSNQKGKLCENTPLVNNIFLSPYFPSHFNLLPLSKVFPLPSPTSSFYSHPPLCADTSTQARCVIPRYRMWTLLLLFSELALFLMGSLFYAEEKKHFLMLYLRNYQFPEKNTIFLFYFPDQVFIGAISHLYWQDTVCLGKAAILMFRNRKLQQN